VRIVFADGDCFYDPAGSKRFSRHSPIRPCRLIGETSIDPAGPYGFANVIVSSFPAIGPRLVSIRPIDHLNNVAFRRSVLERIPIPTRRPCYRMSGLHAAALRRRLYHPASTRGPHATRVAKRSIISSGDFCSSDTTG
jgi:hypothetical protein